MTNQGMFLEVAGAVVQTGSRILNCSVPFDGDALAILQLLPCF